jgi:hypothetical protein
VLVIVREFANVVYAVTNIPMDFPSADPLIQNNNTKSLAVMFLT